MECPQVFSLDVLADRTLLNDVLQGVLRTIFFHRLFKNLRPKTRDLLDLTLPSFDDAELDEVISQRTAALVRSIDFSNSNSAYKPNGGQLAVQFYEKKARKASWFMKAEERVCWEQWVLSITILSPRTEAERTQTRKRIEKQLQATVLAIITAAGLKKDHVPPVSNDPNPFPYTIVLSPKDETWAARMGIF